MAVHCMERECSFFQIRVKIIQLKRALEHLICYYVRNCVADVPD